VRSRRVDYIVAKAYLLHKTPYVFLSVGRRKVEHLKQNVKALDISLSPEQIERIESARPIKLGFPYNIIGHSDFAMTQ